MLAAALTFNCRLDTLTVPPWPFIKDRQVQFVKDRPPNHISWGIAPPVAISFLVLREPV